MSKIYQAIMQDLTKKSKYNLALDIGISEYSLYCYITGFKKVGKRTLKKIEDYYANNNL